uniref:N-alpha-acetyltransferase 20 n=1 Tax=Suricata suricatta TaxID=37032 RepID=A0A673U1R9_SURSU
MYSSHSREVVLRFGRGRTPRLRKKDPAIPDEGRQREPFRRLGCRATRGSEAVPCPARSDPTQNDFRRGGRGPRLAGLGCGDGAMTTLRAFTCDDLFRFNNINLDPLTETYGIPFYLQYLAHWPEYFIVAEAPGGELMGYIMGKAEGSVAREEWHGHVTALSVAPEFRRLGLAAKLMELLEEISERKGGFFVDLFVRVSNQVAVNMYKQLGYSVYRTVIEYYSASNGEPDEDAYDMRKALSRDTEKKSIIPLPHPVRPEDIE